MQKLTIFVLLRDAICLKLNKSASCCFVLSVDRAVVPFACGVPRTCPRGNDFISKAVHFLCPRLLLIDGSVALSPF
uniref:Uncharacterized protein n=1 Tax=Arundo donax TaxID=35708 RepID=A0A0A9DL86_ARUDO